MLASGKTVEKAILKAITYTDIFSYPLTLTEIHRYLIEFEAECNQVEDAVKSLLQQGYIEQTECYWHLPGKHEDVSLRKRRTARSMQLWPYARHYGEAIMKMPFVQMVAVTGSLAVNNADERVDIDYLIVTEPGRLWVTRLLIIGMVRLARRDGVTLCPNYIISTNALRFTQCNLFTAREITQMIPIGGFEIYNSLRESNQWTTQYFPNAASYPSENTQPEKQLKSRLRRIGEVALRTPMGGWLEHWERQRKVKKFNRQYPDATETGFSEDWCKGHFDGHMKRILNTYQSKVEQLNI